MRQPGGTSRQPRRLPLPGTAPALTPPPPLHLQGRPRHRPRRLVRPRGWGRGLRTRTRSCGGLIPRGGARKGGSLGFGPLENVAGAGREVVGAAARGSLARRGSGR